MTHRAAFLSLALAALLPASASAQFTSFVTPPRRDADSAKAAIAAARAATDSIARTTLTDMKAWVDSAAGVAVATADTAAPPAVEPTPGVPAKRTTEFSSGAIAPDTASILPLLAMLGLASLSIGIVLLHRRPRA